MRIRRVKWQMIPLLTPKVSTASDLTRGVSAHNRTSPFPRTPCQPLFGQNARLQQTLRRVVAGADEAPQNKRKVNCVTCSRPSFNRAVRASASPPVTSAWATNKKESRVVTHCYSRDEQATTLFMTRHTTGKTEKAACYAMRMSHTQVYAYTHTSPIFG